MGQYLVQVGVSIWSKLGAFKKKRKLGPDNNPWNVCAQLFFSKKKGWNPKFLQCFLTNSVFEKTNLDQIMTHQKAKLGPDNNTKNYIYVCVYVCIYLCVYVCVCTCVRARFSCLVHGRVWQPLPHSGPLSLLWGSASRSRFTIPQFLCWRTLSLHLSHACGLHLAPCPHKQGTWESEHDRLRDAWVALIPYAGSTTVQLFVRLPREQANLAERFSKRQAKHTPISQSTSAEMK